MGTVPGNMLGVTVVNLIGCREHFYYRPTKGGDGRRRGMDSDRIELPSQTILKELPDGP